MLQRFFLFLSLALFLTIVESADMEAPLIEMGDEQIPLAAFEAYLGKAPPNGQYQLFTNRERLEQVVAHLYLNRTLAKVAVEEGLDQDPVVRAGLQNMHDQYLAKLKVSSVMDEPIPELDKMAREHYQAHLEDYKRPAQLDVAHILIDYRKKASKEEAETLLAELRQRAQEGEDFAALADEHSDDPSVEVNHGHLGWVEQGMLDPQFAEAAFALEKEGEIGDVVESKFGLYIIKLLGRRGEGVYPYDEVKRVIIAGLEADIRKERSEVFVESFKQRALDSINKEVLDAYVEERLKELEEVKQMLERRAEKSVGQP